MADAVSERPPQLTATEKFRALSAAVLGLGEHDFALCGCGAGTRPHCLLCGWPEDVHNITPEGTTAAWCHP